MNSKKLKQVIFVFLMLIECVSCVKKEGIKEFIRPRKITIGYIDTVSNNPYISNYLTSMRFGLETAVNYFNKSHFLGHYNLALKVFNGTISNQSNTAEIDKRIEEFKKEVTSVAVWIDSLSNNNSYRYKQATTFLSIPFIFTLNTGTNIVRGYNNVYQLVPENSRLGFESIDIANQLNAKRIIVLKNLSEPYSIEYTDSFVNYFPIYGDKGSNIINKFNYNTLSNDLLENIIDYIKKNNIDTVYIPDVVENLNVFLKYLIRANLTKVNIIAGDEASSYTNLFKDISQNQKNLPKIYFMSYSNYLNQLLGNKLNPEVQFFLSELEKNEQTNTIMLDIATKYYLAITIAATALEKTLFKTVINEKDAINKIPQIKVYNNKLQLFYKALNLNIKAIKNVNYFSTQVSIEPNGTYKETTFAAEATPKGVIKASF